MLESFLLLLYSIIITTIDCCKNHILGQFRYDWQAIHGYKLYSQSIHISTNSIVTLPSYHYAMKHSNTKVLNNNYNNTLGGICTTVNYTGTLCWPNLGGQLFIQFIIKLETDL